MNQSVYIFFGSSTFGDMAKTKMYIHISQFISFLRLCQNETLQNGVALNIVLH